VLTRLIRNVSLRSPSSNVFEIIFINAASGQPAPARSVSTKQQHLKFARQMSMQ